MGKKKTPVLLCVNIKAGELESWRFGELEKTANRKRLEWNRRVIIRLEKKGPFVLSS